MGSYLQKNDEGWLIGTCGENVDVRIAPFITYIIIKITSGKNHVNLVEILEEEYNICMI